MPINIINLDAGAGVVFLGQGGVTGQDIIQANKKVLSSADQIKISRYCIIDLSDTSEFDVSTREVDIIAAQDREIALHQPDYIVAVVAKSDLAYGVSRMWEAIAETKGIHWETMVFKTRMDAEKWIKHTVKEKYGLNLTMT